MQWLMYTAHWAAAGNSTHTTLITYFRKAPDLFGAFRFLSGIFNQLYELISSL